MTARCAACALANTLKHVALRPLWTSLPDTLGYLMKLEDAQVERLLALPRLLQSAAASDHGQGQA